MRHGGNRVEAYWVGEQQGETPTPRVTPSSTSTAITTLTAESWARVVSEMDALNLQVLVNFGALLPLQCPDAKVSIYNPKSIPDVLDEVASSTIRFRSGRIMGITRHVFRPGVVRGVGLFKIPNCRVSPTYVSQRFVDRWNATGLRGLEFQQVWAA